MLASWLHGVYLFTAIFGVGVTIVDLLGLLGNDHSGAHDTTHGGDHTDVSFTGDHQAGDHQAGTHITDAQHGSEHSPLSENHHIPILSALRYLRMIVYFSVGFGPVGLVAEATGASLLVGLIWALVTGITVTFLGRALFRFQQRDIDSSMKVEDLFLGNAKVIVSLTNQRMGKVRIQIGQSVAERYALAEDAGDSFPIDTEVQVVRVTDECVYVRRADTPEELLQRRRNKQRA